MMGNEQFMAELAYQASLAIAQGMLRSGCLTDGEFLKVRTLLLDTYKPAIGGLFAEIP